MYENIIGKTFTSKYGEKYIVLEAKVNGKHRSYLIEFIDTNFKTKTRYENIINGRVRDWSKLQKADSLLGKVCKNNIGDEFMVLNEKPVQRSMISRNLYYKVRFLSTGFEDWFRSDCILKGAIKDKAQPMIVGVGFIGNASKAKNRKAYELWRNMICRCYDSIRHDYYRYGGKGVTVEPRWHSFENFLHDIRLLEGYDETLFLASKIQLDKDKKQFHLPHGERVYSKDTCVWLSPKENSKFSTRWSK